MAGTKRVINIGTNPDDGTGDLLRVAFDKINQNFDDVWTYTAVNSNLDITGDSINGTTDVIINPADGSAFKVTGDTIINPDGGNYNFTINGDLHNDVLYVQASTGRVGIRNTSPSVTFDVTGDAKVSGMTTANNLTVTGNTILGDANTDTITFNAKPSTHILPYSNLINLGASSNRWGTVYSTNLDVSGSISGTFTGTMTSTLTGNVNNTNVTTVNLAVTGPSNVHDLNVTGNLVVQGTTTTLETNDVLVNNQITFEGATADAHETILTVTEPTQDNTITFKNASGTVAFLTDVPTRITDLSDVDTSSVAPTNGQALVWNNADLEWQPGTITSIAYTDLSVTTNPVGTASLIYNSTNGEFTYTPPDLSSYLTSETSHADVLVDSDFASAGIMKTDGAGTYSIATDNSANWDTAYGWGDHSIQGYVTANQEKSFTVHTADFNATSGSRHAVDTSSNIVTATLPGSPATGDAIFFADAGGNYATNNLTIDRNGNTIMGLAQDMTVSTNNQSFGLFYNGTTWRTY